MLMTAKVLESISHTSTTGLQHLEYHSLAADGISQDELHDGKTHEGVVRTKTSGTFVRTNFIWEWDLWDLFASPSIT